MASFEEIIKDLEGVIPPSVISSLEDAVKAKSEEFIKAAEDKFGVAPAVVSDVTAAVKDAAPAAAQAVEDALPPSAAALVETLTSQLKALQAQVDSLKTQGAANQTTVIGGQGEPVLHTLFLEDGTVVQNHPGIATHYSVTNPATATSDATDTVKRVIAAYPTA